MSGRLGETIFSSICASLHEVNKTELPDSINLVIQ